MLRDCARAELFFGAARNTTIMGALVPAIFRKHHRIRYKSPPIIKLVYVKDGCDDYGVLVNYNLDKLQAEYRNLLFQFVKYLWYIWCGQL